MPQAATDRLRQVLDNIREGFVLVDPNFVVLEMNREGERIEGRSAADIVGKCLWESWPHLEQSELGRLWLHSIEEKEPVELDHLYRAPDGREVWLEMRAYPSGGGLAIFYRDVTARRLAEIELLETKRRLDAVLGNTAMAIFLMDERHHCSYMNAAAEKLTGFTLEETRGRPLHDVVHHSHPDGTPYPIEDCAIDRAFPENNRQQGEEVFVHKDGHFYPVAYSASPIRDESSRTIGTIIEARDISARLAAEAELRRTQAELVHLSRVNAMDTMAATLAHELNQPLTALTNYIRGSRRILEAGKDSTRVIQALEQAESGAQRAGEIVRKVRTFVSSGVADPSAQDLPELIEQACVIALVDEGSRGISHEFRFDPDARWVTADPIQVQQVVINLVRNAVEAMEESPRRYLTIETSLTGAFVRIVIADTGPGVDDAIRESLFSPFQSTKLAGVGVGLSICRTIIEAHGGKIYAEPGEEAGTRFCFTLPRSDAPQKLVRLRAAG